LTALAAFCGRMARTHYFGFRGLRETLVEQGSRRASLVTLFPDAASAGRLAMTPLERRSRC
jgi:hypothetical protein